VRQMMWFLCLALWLCGASVVSAQDEHGSHDQAASHGGAEMSATSCDLGIRLIEAAERRLGGFLYAHTASESHMGGSHDHQMAEADAGTSGPVPMMHEHCHPQYGGQQFFMAPNKFHHIETVDSEHCGLRVILYNAHTEAISPARFRAFVQVIQSAEMESERMRFLELSSDGTVLEAMLGSDLSRPFEAELYLRFPENEEPELFNLFISKGGG